MYKYCKSTVQMQNLFLRAIEFILLKHIFLRIRFTLNLCYTSYCLVNSEDSRQLCEMLASKYKAANRFSTLFAIISLRFYIPGKLRNNLYIFCHVVESIIQQSLIFFFFSTNHDTKM